MSLHRPVIAASRLAIVGLALAARLAGAAATAPAGPPVPPYGVWQGTLGTQAVQVQLLPDSCDASYFYLRHLWGIRLQPQGADGLNWREGTDSDAGPSWSLHRSGPDTLSGEWRDAAGQRRLPLQLKQVGPAPQPATACYGPKAEASNRAFHAPRVAAKQPQARAASYQGHAYQVLSLPGTEVSSVQLPPGPRPQPRLNQRLREGLQAQVAAYYDCQLGASRLDAGQPPQPDYSVRHEPVFWNAHLLVLRESFSYYCGGAYPDAGVASDLVWDLDTDQPLNPDTWLRGTAVRRDGLSTWPAPLRALIARRSAQAGGTDDECAEAVQGADGFIASPRRSGMVFTPVLPHVMRACADDIELPWAQLKPHLSATGAQMLRDKLGP